MAEVRAALEDAARVSPDREPSIAVLPFANLSADKENEYFSDGLAEEIINALTQIPGLKVTARTSAFAFRGKEQDIRKIAEALDVRTVLEGSVRRAGNRIRVTAQLINAADGYHLWSERYDRELADVFAVQDEIAAAIAKALQVKLAGESVGRRRYTPSLPCYEAYLRALHESQKLTPDAMARSKEWYERAIALDPGFALAHSMFGFHFAQLANYGLLPAHEAMPLVRNEARKALAIDPSLPEGHATLGLVAGLYDYDWQEAARRFELAMAGDPVPSQVRRYYALYYLLPVGRAEEAVEECTRALQEDPLDLSGRLRLAQCLQAAGRPDEASSELRRVLELDENLWFTHFIWAYEQLREGRLADAITHADTASTLAPWSPSAKGLLAGVCKANGDIARSEELLEKLRPGRAYGTPLALATFHLACSEIEACADWTERAIAERHPAIFFFLRAHAHALLEEPALANLGETAESDATRRYEAELATRRHEIEGRRWRESESGCPCQPPTGLCCFLDCVLRREKILGAFLRRHEIDADALRKCAASLCEPRRTGRPRSGHRTNRREFQKNSLRPPGWVAERIRLSRELRNCQENEKTGVAGCQGRFPQLAANSRMTACPSDSSKAFDIPTRSSIGE